MENLKNVNEFKTMEKLKKARASDLAMIEYFKGLPTKNIEVICEYYERVIKINDKINHIKILKEAINSTLNRDIVYILLQELYENDLFDIEDIKERYDLTQNQIKTLNKIYNELYE